MYKKYTKPSESAHKRDKSSQKENPFRQEGLLLPIVGIGASGGGLESELREENAKRKNQLEAGG